MRFSIIKGSCRVLFSSETKIFVRKPVTLLPGRNLSASCMTSPLWCSKHTEPTRRANSFSNCVRSLFRYLVVTRDAAEAFTFTFSDYLNAKDEIRGKVMHKFGEKKVLFVKLSQRSTPSSRRRIVCSCSPRRLCTILLQ